MIMLTLISLAAAVIIIVLAVLPLHCKWWWKAAISAAALAVALYFRIMRLLGGPLPFAPDLPGWFILLASWLYMTLMAYFIGLVALTALRVLMRWSLPFWRDLAKEKRRSYCNRAHLALLVAVALLCTAGEYNALQEPVVKYVTLQLPVRKPVSIALLSDLHADALKDSRFMRRIVELTNEQQPDIVAITGDFTDGSVERNRAAFTPLRELQAPLGVYGAPGNHEYYSGYDEWNSYLSSLGIRMLNNEREILSEQGIVLAGITDPAAKVFDKEQPNIRKALEGIPEDTRAIILLAHQPKLAEQAEPMGVSLQLSGHTHGGLTPGLAEITAAYNSGFVSGLYRTGRMWLYVSPGTSLWSGLPLRLGVPAEITIIRIIGLTPSEQQTTNND